VDKLDFIVDKNEKTVDNLNFHGEYFNYAALPHSQRKFFTLHSAPRTVENAGKP
jgi:hypothetical protein